MITLAPLLRDQSIKKPRRRLKLFEIPSRDSLYPTSWTTFSIVSSAIKPFSVMRLHLISGWAVLCCAVWQTGVGCEHFCTLCHCENMIFCGLVSLSTTHSQRMIPPLFEQYRRPFTRVSDAEVLICIAVPHLLSRTYNFGFVLFID